MPYNLSEAQLQQLQSQAQSDQVRRQTASTADPTVASNLTDLASTYTGITPGVAASLAQAGIGVGDLGNSVWQKELATRLKRTPGTRSAASRFRNVADPIKYAEGLSDEEKAALTPADLRALKKAVLNQLDDGTGGVLDTIGDIVGTGVGKAYEYTLEKPMDEVIKPVVRQGMVGLQAGGELMAGAARQAGPIALSVAASNPALAGLLSGDDDPVTAQKKAFESTIENPLAPVEQTTAYQAWGKGLSTGQGFLPDPHAPAGRAQAAAAREYSPYLVGGHAWTPGRALADGVGLEPDDFAFDLASGLVDFTVALKADPANFALKGMSKIRTARSQLVTDEVAGAINSHRKMFSPKDWSTWSQQKSFRDLVTHISAEPSPTAIRRALKGRGGYIPVELAYKLAKSQTDEDTVAILKQAVGAGSDLPNVVKWKQPKFFADPRYRNPRLLQDMPSRELSYSDKADLGMVSDEFDNVMVNMKMPQAERDMLLDELADIAYEPDIPAVARARSPIDFPPREKPTFEWGGGGTPQEQLKFGDVSTKFGGETTPFPSTPIRETPGVTRPPIDIPERPSPTFEWGAGKPLTVYDRQKKMTKVFFDAIGEHLKYKGLSDDIVEEAREKSFKSWNDHHDSLIDDIGDPLITSHQTQIGPDGIPLVHRGDEMTLFDNHIIFPEAREVRRMVSTLAPLVDHPLFRNTTIVMDTLLGVWKSAVLTRPATAMRVVGEEQIRIAVDGYASLFHHPMTAISYALGNPDNHWIEKMAGHKLTKGAAGKLLDFEVKHGYRPYMLGGLATNDDMFVQAMYRRFEALGRDTRGLKEQTSALTTVSRYHDLAPVAMGGEIERLRGNQVARILVEGGTQSTANRQAAIDSLVSGELKATPLFDDAGVEAQMASREILAAAEVDAVSKAINLATKDNPKLLDAIATGFIDGHPVTRYNGRISKASQRSFKAMLQSEDDMPDMLRIDKWYTLDKAEKARRINGLDSTLDYLMDAVLTRPSNFFSRNPYLQQRYLEELKRAMPYVDADGRRKILSELGDANLPKKQAEEFRYMDSRLRRIEEANAGPAPFLSKEGYAAKKAAGLMPVKDTISYDAAVLFAKKRAVDGTKDLLYDLSKRSQIMDIMRIIFPFGEAFKEVTTRWVKLTYQNPNVLRRLEQGMQGARSTGSGQVFAPLTGIPAQEDQGLFYKDQFGQEVMGIPGGQVFSDVMMRAMGGEGLGIPLKGSVQGLNLVGQGIPGTNPILQIPMSYMVPDKPSWDWFRNMVFPYGLPKGEGMFNKLTRSMVPSAVLKMHDALFLNPQQDRTYASSVKDVAAYLLSTHKYDIQGANADDEINRLLADAKKGAELFGIVRGMGQFTMPTAPSPEWLAFDKKGNLTLMWQMREWYQDRVDGNKKKGIEGVGYEQAGQDFLNRFGLDNILLTQPKSKALIPAAPITTDAHAWVRSNPDLQKDFPTTYGLFAPSTGEFDNDAYQAQFERGEREDITAKDMIHLANKRLASLVYNRFKTQMGPKFTKPEEDSLRELRNTLTKEFPGYGEDPIPFARTEIIINELERAVEDPRLRKTEAGKALSDYLYYRNNALFRFPAGFASGAATATRAILRQQGEALVDKYPAFQPMWDSVFYSEVKKVI